jgi:hypothetical protein
MNNRAYITGKPFTEWDMNKILKMLRRNGVARGFEDNKNEEEVALNDAGIFQFLVQLLNDRPAYIYCAIDAIINSHTNVSQYLKHINAMGEEKKGYKDIPYILDFICQRTRNYIDQTTIPEGTLMN